MQREDNRSQNHTTGSGKADPGQAAAEPEAEQEVGPRLLLKPKTSSWESRGGPCSLASCPETALHVSRDLASPLWPWKCFLPWV